MEDATSPNALELDKLALERERFSLEREQSEAELRFRAHQLALAEREQIRKDTELDLHRQEKTGWSSPLALAILAAGLAATGNGVVAMINGYLQYRIENLKTENAVITKMLSTDEITSITNLKFALETHLIKDPKTRMLLREYLATHTIGPSTGPQSPTTTLRPERITAAILPGHGQLTLSIKTGFPSIAWFKVEKWDDSRNSWSLLGEGANTDSIADEFVLGEAHALTDNMFRATTVIASSSGDNYSTTIGITQAGSVIPGGEATYSGSAGGSVVLQVTITIVSPE